MNRNTGRVTKANLVNREVIFLFFFYLVCKATVSTDFYIDDEKLDLAGYDCRVVTKISICPSEMVRLVWLATMSGWLVRLCR
jgi:hypothetical protein